MKGLLVWIGTFIAVGLVIDIVAVMMGLPTGQIFTTDVTPAVIGWMELIVGWKAGNDAQRAFERRDLRATSQRVGFATDEDMAKMPVGTLVLVEKTRVLPDGWIPVARQTLSVAEYPEYARVNKVRKDGRIQVPKSRWPENDDLHIVVKVRDVHSSWNVVR